MSSKQKRIESISVDCNESILSILKKMDELDVKLFIVLENGKYKSLISIGDIQRAIINNVPLESKISGILRPKVRVATASEPFEKIQERMIQFRTECMPVINDQDNITDVYFWDELFSSNTRKASKKLNIPVVIMAGGTGSRLKPFSNIIPKPLFPVGDKAIIEEIVNRFSELSVDTFYISVNYKHEMIRYHFDQIKNKSYSINFFQEDKPLGTAGSLSLLKEKINTTFFVTNCDILVQQDYHNVYEYHKEKNNEITIVASLKHYNIPYGTIETGEDGELLSMKEKPELTFKINTGMYILEPHLLKEIPNNTFFHITELIEKVKGRGGKVGVFPVSEKSWFDIGQWNEYQKTLDFFNSGDS